MSDERHDDILQIMLVFESQWDNKLEKRFETKTVSWRNMKQRSHKSTIHHRNTRENMRCQVTRGDGTFAGLKLKLHYSILG